MRSLEQRLVRAGLETQFKRLYQDYTQNGFNTEDAYKTALEQITPAIMDWESTNKEIVNSRRFVNQKRAKEIESRKEELAARIMSKQRQGLSSLEESEELFHLENPDAHIGKKPKGDPWGDLALEVSPDKKCDYREVVDWVFNNVATPVEALSPLDVPSRGAVTMLRQVKENPAMYQEFMRSHWSKLIPSRSQIEAESRFRDGNSKVFKLFDAFEEDLRRRRKSVFRTSKGDPGESASPEDEQDAHGTEESD